MQFLVNQMFIEKSGSPLRLFTAIRKVKANSKAEAIGKFIEDTASLPFERRLEPVECFLLKDLKQVV